MTSSKYCRYPSNPSELNPSPKTQGRYDEWGNSGVVTVHAYALPITGKSLFLARPEFARGSDNPDAQSSQVIPGTGGEIVTQYDPIENSYVTVHTKENVFCGAATLLADGTLFLSGGMPYLYMYMYMYISHDLVAYFRRRYQLFYG